MGFKTFSELLESPKYIDGTDFEVTSEDRRSRYLIAAPHGGRIEPRSSEIATALASDDLSLYLFEGIMYGKGNSGMHVDSTGFDEPEFERLAKRHDLVVAIHGCRNGPEEPSFVLPGGLDEDRKLRARKYLRQAGFEVEDSIEGLDGKDPRNLCNRGLAGRGLQFEISDELRRELVPRLGEVPRGSEPLDDFCAAIREALRA